MIYDNILELIGETPLVKINKLVPSNTLVLAKLEYFNPANSIKDRVAYNMLIKAMREGKINSESVIIEPTSGNTGIGLALCASVLGLRSIFVMPETMSQERKKMLKGYGAELVLTSGDLGMQGAVDKAIELAKEIPNSYIPSQFTNPDNPAAHRQTAMEIWRDTNGKVTRVVAGIGTGGTISGVGKTLKALNPQIEIIGVEPSESPLLTQGFAKPHKIQGIGANFIPQTYDSTVVDKIVAVSDFDAIECAKSLAKFEGMLCGISSGAAFKAALEQELKEGEITVVIMPDYGERYISTELFE